MILSIPADFQWEGGKRGIMQNMELAITNEIIFVDRVKQGAGSVLAKTEGE